MTQGKDPVQDADGSSQALPLWYAEIPAADRSEDFHQEVGKAHVFLCERGMKQLIISFGHTEDTDHRELDWPAWTDRLARQHDWSHLAITAPRGSWFRDAHLIETLQKLRDLGFFKRFGNVTLFGAASKGGGFAALAFAPLCPGAVVLAFDAQSTLKPSAVPWEDRFSTQTPGAWSLPYSDTARALTATRRAYVAYDPFERRDARHVARLPAKRVTPLRAFGLYDDIGIALKRLGLMDEILVAAVAGTLEPAGWYAMLRKRRDLYLYRCVMEDHLAARNKTVLSVSMVNAFRRRNRQRKAQATQATQATQAGIAPPSPPPQQEKSPDPFVPPPTLPDRPSSPALAGRRYPRTLGNVWALRDEPTGFRYMSDQYEGRTMGFEERNEITLGETHPLAIGMAALGHRVGVARPLPEDYRYHVVDAALAGHIAPFQAKSHGVIAQRHAAARRHTHRTILALSTAQAGITQDEATPQGAPYDALLQQIGAAREVLQGWNKGFHLDRIALSLLSGAPGTSLQAALQHYGDVAHSLRHDAAVAAGQASFPHIVVSQSAGSATDGRSEVILAEGQLDVVHPALGIIVATPQYPFALMPDTTATHDPAAQMLIDELEVLAVETVQDNRRWYCPSMQQAFGRKRTLVVEFSALGDLVLGDGFHGFAIHCGGTSPDIKQVEVAGTRVTLTLDRDLPEGDAQVTYAWGASRSTGGDNRTANQGALRDSWSGTSVMQPGRTLHRHALAGRVRIMPSDLLSAGRST